MVEIEVEYDAFLSVIDHSLSLSRWTGAVVYACDCGCIFVPSSEGSLGWYVDRYEPVGADGLSCGQNCPCHEVPLQVDLEGKETNF